MGNNDSSALNGEMYAQCNSLWIKRKRENGYDGYSWIRYAKINSREGNELKDVEYGYIYCACSLCSNNGDNHTTLQIENGHCIMCRCRECACPARRQEGSYEDECAGIEIDYVHISDFEKNNEKNVEGKESTGSKGKRRRKDGICAGCLIVRLFD